MNKELKRTLRVSREQLETSQKDLRTIFQITFRQRDRVMCETNDGFRIAEEDLKMRGPGDFFGSRQSGLPAFRVASLSMDLQTLKDAQAASAAWINDHGTAQTPEGIALRQRIGELFRRSQGTWN